MARKLHPKRVWKRITKRNERGVSMVEAAIIMPVVMLAILGILEGALLFRTYLSGSNAANGGARTGSIEANTKNADYDILQSIVKNAPGASEKQITNIIVYKATGPGAGPSAQCINAALSGSDVGISTGSSRCNVYVNADLHRPVSDFGPGGFGADQYYAPQSRTISASAGTDWLGVWIQTQCQCLSTTFFGITPTLHATSVVQVEAASA